MFNFSILYVLKQSKLDVGFRHLQLLLFHEPMAGIEPATSSLPRKCSTTELQQRKKRAEDGTQTRDPQLGRLMLYQLSYSRNFHCRENVFFDLPYCHI